MRMGSPHGQCHSETKLHMTPLPRITYTSKACGSVCAELDIMKVSLTRSYEISLAILNDDICGLFYRGS